MRALPSIVLVTLAFAACSSDDASTDATDTTTTTTDTTSADTGTATGATDTGAGGDTGATADSQADSSEVATSCVDRECGPDPVTHADCGACAGAGLLACNDGTCEATCDDVKCAAMGYSENTCVSTGPCDGSPDGFVGSTTYACSGDDTTCEMTATAVDCGLLVTDCSPCDLAGTGDGLCKDDVCKSVVEASCKPAACGQRECGPAPTTHENCGTCAGAGMLACNDGTCEATCIDAKCGAMNYTENTCVSSGECDGSPDGFIGSTMYTCSGDDTTCDEASTAVDCGLSQTNCSTCDLNGTDDGLCKDDVCVAPGETECK